MMFKNKPIESKDNYTMWTAIDIYGVKMQNFSIYGFFFLVLVFHVLMTNGVTNDINFS